MLIDSFEKQKVFKIARYKCLRSFLFQTRYMFRHMYHSKFIVAEHHRKIAEALEKVLSGEITRLIINVPPRFGKTELAVKNFIAHGLALNPAAKFIHLSYADSLALDNSETARDIVKSKEYQELFPYVKIKGSTDSKKKWYTTENGGVYATSTGGQVTGYGAGRVDAGEDNFDPEELDKYVQELVDSVDGVHIHPIEKKKKFAGAIIIDDPIKPDDADSELIRNKVNNRFNSTIRNRVNSINTPIIIIMQRLHEDDLCGHLIDTEPNDWTVVTLPAIKEDGTALWHERFPLENLLIEEARDAVIFSRQYMQNPMPREGLLFPEDELRKYPTATFDPAEKGEYSYCYIDPADEGGDDLAGVGGYLIGKDFYVTDALCNTFGTDVNEPIICDLIVDKKINHTDIEGNSAWILFAKSIRKKVGLRTRNSKVLIIKNSVNKRTRIIAASSWVKNHMVFRDDYKTNPEQGQYKKFMKQLTSYMKVQVSANEQDGPPDAVAGTAVHFQRYFSHLY